MARVTGRFAGLRLDDAGASFTLQTGFVPSHGRVTLAASSVVTPETGDLELHHGSDTVRLRNVRAERRHVIRDANGVRLELKLTDRRWAWAFGSITGAYNTPLRDGTHPKERSLRGLAELCLRAMGEARYSVSALPSDLFPAVAWTFENPAVALEALLDGRYSVALGVDDTVRIFRYGAGATLPPGEKSRVARGSAVTPKPERTVVRGGRTIREITASGLRAVGEELDGRVVPIENLSYSPNPGATDGGWGTESLSGFQNIADEAARALAEKSVFKWYRLPEGSPRPILDERAASVAGLETPVRLLPTVVGMEDRWDGQTWQRDTQKGAKSGYALDRTEGVVRFQRWITTAPGEDHGSETLAAAELDLIYAYELNAGNETDYYTLSEGSAPSARATVIHRPELVLLQIDAGQGPVDQNRDELDAMARKEVTLYREERFYSDSETVEYNTLLPVSPDGAIAAVRWQVNSHDGASTLVERTPPRPARLRRAPVATGPARKQRSETELGSREGQIAGEYRGCLNESSYDIPANSLVEITGWDSSAKVVTVSRPVTADAPVVMLVPHALAAGALGKAYETGTHGLVFDATVPSNPPSDPVGIGDRLGSVADSFHGVKSPAGMLRVKAVIRSATSADPTGLALVEVADPPAAIVVTVTDISGGSLGNYKAKHWGLTRGSVGTAFDLKGVPDIFAVNDIRMAVRDADGTWWLNLSPYATWA